MAKQGFQGYREYQQLDLTAAQEAVLKFWEENRIFEKSIEQRSDSEAFTFYEGPPSVNGKPGIHHVLSRTVKDIFCRYKTNQGYKVRRKSGWDTHGLPVELQVEKRLGITKDDIGDKVSVAYYNEECRKDVLQYKSEWEELTRTLGFWLDFDDVYITYDRHYIESLWWVIKQLFDKDLLYRDYSIQPYSPAAGTALSSHELNQPGCYRSIKDTSVTAQFKLKDADDAFLLAWTTTPWTLPSNTGLAVGPEVEYVKVRTFNPYTAKPITVYLAKDTLPQFFNPDYENAPLEFEEGQKQLPYQIEETLHGKDMEGWRYEQLLPYVQPEQGDPFRVVTGDFVTTDEGTGIVHLAPTFGEDDFRVGKEKDLPPLTVPDPDNPNRQIPLVDRNGRFVEQVTDFAGRFVRNYADTPEEHQDVDVDIAVKLKKENKAFKVEKYEHNYPHCWRTDRPLLYYPLEAWFVRVTPYKDRMIELNNTIGWKPQATGEGRFGNWLENLVDWNLSRSRYWGTPLPIWITEDRSEVKCIGSLEELRQEVDKAIEAGIRQEPLAEDYDPHRPYVDEVTLISDSGKPMKRVSDVVDVWFDSGSMPYAQWHYPFENQEIFNQNFPADFIAEGVDQTRGWFYTLHALGTLLYDSVAYRNVIANGLVLDKNGNKMSKRLGNVVDPFDMLNGEGADATRWYMVHNAQLWDDLKFDPDGVAETKRKFFGTLFNVYGFFAMYANIDGFQYQEAEIPLERRPELDRWIISLLNTLVKDVEELMDNYEPTWATRKIQDFVVDNLSNWYVRLSRRRFWKGDYTEEKIAAYQTIYYCLETIAHLIAPFAPFYAERLFQDLNSVSGRIHQESVHLSYYPAYQAEWVDKPLEGRMGMAQEITTQALSLRKREDVRVRQPLNRIILATADDTALEQVKAVEDLIKSEVNIKAIDYMADTSDIVVKSAKPNFKKLGPKYGKKMKSIQQVVENLDQGAIQQLETDQQLEIEVEGERIQLGLDDVDILTEDIPGWQVATTGKVTIALDITITEDLQQEGLARELVNRIQTLRKQKGLAVTDTIEVEVSADDTLQQAIAAYQDYICRETLAKQLTTKAGDGQGEMVQIQEHEAGLALAKV